MSLRHIEQEPVKLPYSVVKVQKQQNRLTQDKKLSVYIGKRLDVTTTRSLARFLRVKLRYESVPASFYEMSLDQFRYKTITKDAWQHTLRRIAAIIELRNAENPLRPAVEWTRQAADEWVPVLVEDAFAKPGKSFEGLWVLRCVALGGYMAEVQFSYVLSTRMAYRVGNLAGFSHRDPGRLIDLKQFVGLQLVLRIQKDSTPDHVVVLDAGKHPASVTNNRNVNKARNPAYRDCPYGMTVYCFQCGIGQDNCPLAVISVTEEDRYLKYNANHENQDGTK